MKQTIIDKVLKHGVKISDTEYQYVLPEVELHPYEFEALTEIAVHYSAQGDSVLMTRWKDYKYNDYGELELYDDICAGWVDFDDLSPSEVEVLNNVEWGWRTTGYIIEQMRRILNGATIFFDEVYTIPPKITINGEEQRVELATITEKNDLLFATTDKSLFVLSPAELNNMDKAEMMWLLHEIFFEIEHDCDIDEWEVKYNEIFKN